MISPIRKGEKGDITNLLFLLYNFSIHVTNNHSFKIIAAEAKDYCYFYKKIIVFKYFLHFFKSNDIDCHVTVIYKIKRDC